MDLILALALALRSLYISRLVFINWIFPDWLFFLILLHVVVKRTTTLLCDALWWCNWNFHILAIEIYKYLVTKKQKRYAYFTQVLLYSNNSACKWEMWYLLPIIIQCLLKFQNYFIKHIEKDYGFLLSPLCAYPPLLLSENCCIPHQFQYRVVENSKMHNKPIWTEKAVDFSIRT